MRVACIGYRPWALKIYDHLANSTDQYFYIVRNRKQYNEDILHDFRPDIILYYGWSWIVPARITSKYKCVMLHPSPLPKYRGGSPIQNQIIAGEKESAVSLIFMEEKVDAGDIIAQKPFSLEGSLDDIFSRIIEIGILLTQKHILGIKKIITTKQDENLASYCERRHPEESEITIEELQCQTAEFLYNKVRMLADPYPNAFIKTVDNKRLVLNSVRIEE